MARLTFCQLFDRQDLNFKLISILETVLLVAKRKVMERIYFEVARPGDLTPLESHGRI